MIWNKFFKIKAAGENNILFTNYQLHADNKSTGSGYLIV